MGRSLGFTRPGTASRCASAAAAAIWLLLLLLFAVEVLVVLGRELLELDEEVHQMRLERRQVHPQVEAAHNEIDNLLVRQIREARLEQIRHVFPHERRFVG